MLELIKEDRITQLEALLEVVAEAIDNRPGARDLAQLAKQYREILQEIADIKGLVPEEDELSELLSNRQANGKSGSVR